jgi:hypothetical protein
MAALSPRGRRGRRAGAWRACAAALLAAALGATSCARTLVDRAIAARGGPLAGITREVRAEVHEGIPGDWTWELAYRAPRDVRWTLHTWGEEQSYVLEGGRASYTLGSARLPVPPEAMTSLATQSRWLAVTSLDVLREPALAAWTELPREGLPAGVASGLEARLLDGGPPYRLYFDDADRLVLAEGEIALPPIGSGHLRVRYRDFRETDGHSLPRRAIYELDGRPLLEEKVLGYTLDPG